MSVWMALAAAVLLQTQQVELQTLSEEKHIGVLTQLSAEGAVVTTSEGEVVISNEDLLEVVFSDRESARPPRRSVQLSLIDESSVSSTSFSTTPRRVKIEIPAIGSAEIPIRALQAVRFHPLDATVKKTWAELKVRALKSDTLVIRKENVLDFFPGVIGDVDEKSVKFLLDGEEVTLPRKKVFGLIYYHRTSRKSSPPVCGISLANGDLLNARSVELSDDRLLVKLSAGGTVTIPVAVVRSLDFSQGKVVYLSSMEPRVDEYSIHPQFKDDVVEWKYWRDRTSSGNPLRLFGKTYSRGLWIHSYMKLKYRLRGDYRRFKAVMGIDEGVEGGWGDVDVKISADGKVLYEGKVTGRDKGPHPLDLDVTGARDLEIIVDYGRDFDLCDQLVLANARLIK